METNDLLVNFMTAMPENPSEYLTSELRRRGITIPVLQKIEAKRVVPPNDIRNSH